MFHLIQVFNDRGGYEASSRIGSLHSGISPEESVHGFGMSVAVVELIGIEPTTSGLQSPRSPS